MFSRAWTLLTFLVLILVRQLSTTEERRRRRIKKTYCIQPWDRRSRQAKRSSFHFYGRNEKKFWEFFFSFSSISFTFCVVVSLRCFSLRFFWVFSRRLKFFFSTSFAAWLWSDDIHISLTSRASLHTSHSLAWSTGKKLTNHKWDWEKTWNIYFTSTHMRYMSQ